MADDRSNRNGYLTVIGMAILLKYYLIANVGRAPLERLALETESGVEILATAKCFFISFFLLLLHSSFPSVCYLSHNGSLASEFCA